MSIVALALFVGAGGAHAASESSTASAPRFEAQTSEDFTVTLSLGSSSLRENDEEAEITVNAELSTSRNRNTTISIQPKHDTTSSSDFSFTGDTLTIAAGNTSASGTVTVTPTDDEIVEGREEFEVVARVGGVEKGAYTFTINDDDEATLSITGPSSKVSEGGSARFTVTISHAVSRAVTANLELLAQKADNLDLGDGEQNIINGSVTFPANSRANSTRTFSLPVFNDMLSEEDEDFAIQIYQITGDLYDRVSASSDARSATATIAESDPLKVSISGPTGTVTEGSYADFTVTLSPQGVLPTESLSVAFATSDGTASSDIASAIGNDYSSTTTAVYFPAHSNASQTVSVYTVDDNVDESSKTFTATISHPSGGGGPKPTLGNNKSATATIADNDDPPTAITLSASNATVYEGGDSEVTINADLVQRTVDGPAVTLGSDLTVTIRLRGTGTTASTNDYTVTEALASVVIPAGLHGGSGTLTIAATEDAVVEGNETITVRGSASRFTVAPTQITVVDDNHAYLSVSGPSADVTEGVAAVFTVTLTLSEDDVRVDRALTVGWSADDENWLATAVASDFGPQQEGASRSGTVTFPARSVSGAQRTFRLTTQNDNLSEDSETFFVALGPVADPFADVVTVYNPSAFATIAESDPPIVSISGPSAHLEEGEDAEFTVSLSGGVPTDTVSVGYATSDGTAEAGSDFTGIIASVLWFDSDATDPQTITVSTIDDTQDESDETFGITISNPLNLGGPTPTIATASATATITDNDEPSTRVTLSANPNPVDEGEDADITITATLDGTTLASDLNLQIYIAAASADYVARTPHLRNVTIKAGQSSGSGTLKITATEDADVEGDETITVGGRAQGVTITPVNITITDNDSATLSISGPSGEVAEGSNAAFTVTLSNNVDAAVTVALSAALSAGAGDALDFRAPPSTLTFAANSGAGATRTVSIPAIDDNLSEYAETFSVSLGAITGDLASKVSLESGESSAGATIAASDPITVSLSGPAAVEEGSETAAYTVSLSGGTPTANLTVNYATANGTAVAGTDYTAESSRLTFASDDHADKTFTVQTAADTDGEGDETFSVSLSSPSGGGGQAPVLGTSSVTTTIEDMAVSLSVDTSSLAESASATNIVVTATLDGGKQFASDTEITVFLEGTAGTDDYTASSLSSITINAGESSGTGTLTVTPTDDEIVEGDETITVGGRAATAAVSSADITITDNDTATLSLSGPSGDVTEGSNAAFSVTSSHSFGAAVTVAVSAVSGSAIAGTDFSAPPSTVTFGANFGSGATQLILIPVTNDSLSENAEDFSVSLGAITGDLASLVSLKSGESSASATIAASHRITVSLSGPTVVDERGETADYTVSLSGGTPTADLTVNYATADNTAVAGSDYTAQSGTLTFTSADHADKTVSVQTTADTVTEGDETFSIAISGASGGGGQSPVLGASSLTTTIEEVGITLSVDTASLAESASETAVVVTATLDEGDERGSDVTVDVTLGGTAGSGDYSASGLSSITITAGESSGTGTLTVTPTDDAIVEGAETITVAGSSAGIVVSSTDITITDDDTATLSLSSPSDAATEGSNAAFTVTLSHAIGSDVTVAWSAASGSAISGSDFSASASTVTFAAGSVAGATQTVSIPITDDDNTEDAETFSVSLGAITGDLASLVSLKSGESSASATIALSDLITINVSGTASVIEGGTATYTISLSPAGVIPPPGASLSVDYWTAAGTATQLDQQNQNDADYDWKGATHVFSADNPGPMEVPVRTFDDVRVEEDETFSFVIEEGFFTMGQNHNRLRPRFGTRSVTTTITNDDTVSEDIYLSVTPSATAEWDESKSFVVTATLNREDPATADIPVAIALGGTATESGDYTVKTALSSITIPANSKEGSGTLVLNPIDDSAVELDEVITLSGTATELSVASTGITIVVDINERASLTLTGPSDEVTEGSNAEFTATLSDLVGSEVTANWSAFIAESGDNAEFSDYGSGNGKGSFTIPANTLSHTFTVPIIDDNLAEPAEHIVINPGVITVAGFVTSPVSSGAASSAGATIAASDPTTVSLSGPTVVEEGSETAVYTVSLSGGTPTADLTVSYATDDDTAVAGSDYTAQSGTLTFTSADHADKTFTVQTTSDTAREGDETFTVAISGVSGGGQTPVLGASSVTTTIDEMGITLSVDTASLAESASETEIVVTATVDGGRQLASDTEITISLGGTASSRDYSASGLSSITITAGESSGSGTLTVTPTADSRVEGEETITVAGSAAGIGVSSTAITITDNTSVTLSISGPSEVEEGNSYTYVATLSRPLSKTLTVAWDISADSADYQCAVACEGFVFPPGGYATGLQIVILDDALSENAEAFSVSLGAFTGDLASLVSLKSGESSVSSTIAASDPITVGLSGPAAVAEGGETAAYTVSLSGGTPTADLTVNYATADGTAEAGSDYTAKSGTLTFTSADHADKTFTVQTTADTVDEGDETFTVATSGASGGGGQTPVLGTSSVTTTIGEVGITLSVDTASLAESASATNIVVTAALDGSDALASDTEITISLEGTAGTDDYTANSLSSITITAGESSGSGMLTVTPADDAIVEGDETITVAGSATGIAVSSTAITITDDDTATLSLSGPSGEMTEGSNAAFTVTLSHAIGSDVTVAWSAASGSAISGSDFSASASTVTFGANSAAGATQTVSTPIMDDNFSENAEIFSVSLGAITGDLASLVSLKSGESSASATIAANDRITVSLSGPAIVDEGSETAVYTVSLSDGAPSSDLTVNYATADGTAEAGSDYTAQSGTLTFTSADHADKTFTVQTTSDTVDESDETFTVSLSSASGGGGQAPVLGASSVTTRIEEAGITLSVDTASLAESASATGVVVTATLDGGKQLSSDIEITISLGGTAGAADYSANSLSSITITAGESSGTGTLTVTPTDDAIVEGTETITVAGSATGIVVSSTAITITDDDSATLSLSVPSGEVTEGSNAEFTVTLSHAIGSDVTVAWSAASGIAISETDFSASASTVTFGAGSSAGTTQTISIAVTDDNLSELSEDFSVSLGAVTGDLASLVSLKSGESSVSSTIAASDRITVSLSGPAAVAEGSETSAYTVSLSGGAPTADLTVNYSTADGTAEAGSDYTAKSGTLIFTSANHADKTFTVQTTADTLGEGDETFTVATSRALGGGGQTPVLGASSVTTTIEEAGITLSVDTASLAESASATNIIVTAARNGGGALASDTEITISLGGTAGTDDYSINSLSSITITAGESSGTGTLTVTPTDDAIVEGDETITVAGSSAGIVVSSTDITITDDDTATLSVSGPSGEATEGSNAEFTVTLSHSVISDVTVAWSAASGSAISGSDFSASASTVTFGANSAAGATQTVSTPIMDDNFSENAEIFSVSLGAITGDLASLVSLKSGESSASATIAANDRITVSLSGPAIVDEGSETAVYTVSLSDGAPSSDLTVNYATADGTAEAGSDYTAQSGTLTFTSADHADKTFTVQTTSDTVDESDETFTVSLSSASGGGGQAPVLSASSVTTTIGNVAPEPAPEPPSVPASVQVTTTAGSLDVSVNWDDVDDADSYLVRWRKDVQGTQMNVGVSVTTSDASITVAEYGQWVVRVEACNDVGCSQGASRTFRVEPPPNRAPLLNKQAGHYADFVGTHNAPRGIWVRKWFDGIFIDPDGDALTYTVSVPTEATGLVAGFGVHNTQDLLLFQYDADGDWAAVTPALPNPVVTQVTLTATDPDGLSASVTGPFSAHWEAPTPGIEPPGTPIGLTVTSDPEWLHFSASWEATEQTTHYLVKWRLREETEFLPANTLRVETNGATFSVSDAGQWTVQVEACNASGCGPGVSEMVTTVPARPQHLSISAGQGDLNFNASWGAVEGATSYRLAWRRYHGSFIPGNELDVVGTETAFTVADYGLWAVRLEACAGSICGPGAKETLYLPPPTPQNLSISAGQGDRDFNATWNEVEGATSYNLSWREIEGDFEPGNAVAVTSASASFTVPSYGRWQVRLEACNAAGCGREATTTIDMTPARPQNLVVTSTTGSLSVNATWTAADGATSYRLLWRLPSSDFESGNEVTATGTSATITLSDYGQWVIRLEGCNAAGCGPGASKTILIRRSGQ